MSNFANVRDPNNYVMHITWVPFS